MDKPPIYSRRISAGTRVYYIDVQVDPQGLPYISMSEIPTDKTPGKKKRQRIFIFHEHFAEFVKAFDKASRIAECKMLARAHLQETSVNVKA